MPTKRSFITVIILILILVVIGGAAVALFTAYKIYTPVNRDDHMTIDFVIKEGEGVNQISARLEERDLIADNFYFDMYLWLMWAEGELQAGVYALSRDMRTSMIADILTGGDRPGSRVTSWTGHQLRHSLHPMHASNSISSFLVRSATKSKGFSVIVCAPFCWTIKNF